jgi:hypothetical protein
MIIQNGIRSTKLTREAVRTREAKTKGVRGRRKKTYNSGYSLVVTDPTTNPPIWSLCMAERTGCPVLSNLWSYVL